MSDYNTFSKDTDSPNCPYMSEKTCGTCDNFLRDIDTAHLGACLACYFETDDGIGAYRAVSDVQLCRILSCYVQKQSDTLDHQYKQIEQIAQDMLMYIGSVTFLLDHSFNSRIDAKENATKFLEFERNLKRAGVNQ